MVENRYGVSVGDIYFTKKVDFCDISNSISLNFNIVRYFQIVKTTYKYVYIREIKPAIDACNKLCILGEEIDNNYLYYADNGMLVNSSTMKISPILNNFINDKIYKTEVKYSGYIYNTYLNNCCGLRGMRYKGNALYTTINFRIKIDNL